jgi:hypothetical protein
MRTHLFYLLLAFTIGLVSCEEDTLPDTIFSATTSGKIQTESINELFYANFVYKGNKYESSYYFDGDSAIFEKEEVGELLKRLNSTPTLVTFIYLDQTREYFDNQDEYEMNLVRILRKNLLYLGNYSISTIEKGDGIIPSRDSRYAANMFLFDDRNYSDTKLQFNLEMGQSVFEVPQLRDYGMNDKTTSVVLWCNSGTVEYQLWEDNTYEGHSLIYLLTPNTSHIGVKGRLVIPSLKNIQVEGTKNTWNDRITSIRMLKR